LPASLSGMLRSLSDMVDMSKRAVESSGATEKTKAAIVRLCPNVFVVNAAVG
jgi:hypothetical protein